MPTLTVPPPRPYMGFTNPDGTLTIQGYDFLFGIYLRVGGSLSALNAVTLADKTWDEPDPIGSTTPNTGDFTALSAVDLTVSDSADLSCTGLITITAGTPGAINNLALGDLTPRSVVGTTVTATGAFGCNGAAGQTASASGAVLNAYAGGVFGLGAAADMQALLNKVIAIDAALKANGILS